MLLLPERGHVHRASSEITPLAVYQTRQIGRAHV